MMNNDNLYINVNELIQNLEKIFDKKNKKVKLYDELFNDEFYISFKNNKNKTFNEFLTKFNIFVTFLQLNNNLKIKQLRDKFIEKIRYRMSHFKNCDN